MIRTIQDFTDRWRDESKATLKIFNALTDDSLQQAIPDGRTLGRLANHLIESLSEMPYHLGLPIAEETAAYTTVQELIDAYQQAADRLVTIITSEWNDATLEAETNMYGRPWKNGFTLWVLLVHQTHHRAQMTVLMRFAGLKVPGVYGPAREEWIAMGKTPLE